MNIKKINSSDSLYFFGVWRKIFIAILSNLYTHLFELKFRLELYLTKFSKPQLTVLNDP